MSNNIDALKMLYYVWIFIAVTCFVAVVVRTIKFGFFYGKDFMLWMILAYAIFSVWRRRTK